MASDSSRRPSKRKSTAPGDADSSSAKHVRKCERTGCPAKAPICFASASERCVGNGYTSRWYHMSQSEHYCNECFDHYYRSHKDGYAVFALWKRKWSTYGTTDPNIKAFMMDTMLPYWVQCTQCEKWRQMTKDSNISPDFLKKYVCGMSTSGFTKSSIANACDSPEDYRVEYTKDYNWMTQLIAPPYLKNSPAFPFLSSYFPDCVGMSATDMEVFNQSKSPDMPAYLSPFVTSDQSEPARCFQPGAMDELELTEFPEFAKIPTLYLAIRNVCVTLWNLNPKKWLSHERCGPFIICRGMTRIWCINSLQSILWHLTRRGLINFGLLSLPKEIDFMPKDILPQDNHVLIIGAGVSGLSAAHQLNHFGVKTTILEAKDRIGGRIHDDCSLGLTVGKGAQIINGCDNNPLIVLSHQTGVHIKELSEKCCLLQKGGVKVEEKTDSQMDFHFNAILDIIADWRRNKEILQDLSLMDKFRETHQHFMDESQLTFTKQQETLLNFHFGNLEYACGTSLSNISTMNWDQNEDYPQFSGRNVLLADGFSPILDKITENLDIVYNTEISSIDYSDKVVVKSSDGQSWTGDKVIVTLPLAVLKNGIVQFNPPLPQNKVMAIQQLGVGYMEKVVLQFKERFWSDISSPAEVFGRVETEFSRRGLFGIFHDLSKEIASGKSCYILSTHICGDSVEILKQKSDEEIVAMCIETLSELFPKKKVPNPQKYLVTRWYKDKYVQMAYSHIPVGASGDLYDDIAEDVQGKIFFAGEATNRQHPQSVTGAYISGMREAEKVFTSMAVS
ncbi:lysine-specific histone demethylase 2-like [Mytilus californianus]|uniref:lysine-specific histone demethylase 2-like n=1 Tax=Mytilus californianus TaxID=6549 RepID=UPI0022477E4E|nr:lysine-specific histone demethylase 2-like [Mytilus californianus]